jgi:hypothetical protein
MNAAEDTSVAAPRRPGPARRIVVVGGMRGQGMTNLRVAVGFLTAGLLVGTAGADPPQVAEPASSRSVSAAERLDDIRRAQVWKKTDVPSMDLRAGPAGSLAPHQDVTCDYVPSKKSGNTPKFECALAPGDVVKVKYGETVGKVYAAVAATRLFWALGFGADRNDQVRVTCRGCPADPWKATEPRLPSVVFEWAIIERPMKGHEIETHPDQGWKFDELDLVDPAQGGAPAEQRDALRLLAVFVQHSDNKASNQRLTCLPKEPGAKAAPAEPCREPMLYVHDLGSTFGRGSLVDVRDIGSANFKEWSRHPLWQDATSCRTHLGGNVNFLPWTWSANHYTLKDPVITEAGRRFLADLLVQLRDEQIRDMFDVAGSDQRHWPSAEDVDRNGTLDQWVAAFKARRDELVRHTCPR